MQIRKLETQEHGKTRPLNEEVFPEDGRAFVDYYYTEKTKDNEIYVIEEDGDIRAMLHLNPYELLINGREELAHYIVAVATQKEYRKRGYMAALVRRVLRDMYKQGEPFTFLMPAAEKIYLPHDFRTVYEQEKPYCTPGEEPGPDARAAEEEDCAELADWAGACLKEHYQVYAKRSEAYYRRLVKEYASYGGKLMLYRKRGRITDCKIWLPEEEKEKPKIMVRLLDIKKMLRSMYLTEAAEICLEVTDPVIEENNCRLILSGAEGGGVAVADGTDGKSEGTVTVAAFAALLFGAATAEEACSEEGVCMSGKMKEELGKIRPLSEIYLNEIV